MIATAFRLPDAVAQLSEPTSIALAERIQCVPVAVPFLDEPVSTALVTSRESLEHGETATLPLTSPLVFLPGFDSSLLEFRRLFPLLSNSWTAPEKRVGDPLSSSPTLFSSERYWEIWLVDLLGFGFTERPLASAFTPQTIQTHLYAFWQQYIRRPMVLAGASMGGGAALDFALRYPEAVAQVILLDSAGMQPGPWQGKYLLSPLDRWAVEFLRRPDVRRNISKNAYANPDRCVTLDAECCASLHLLMPNWDEALRRFTRSGGYPSLRSRLAQVTQPTLILWGRQDRILGTKDALLFEQILPQGKLVWIEASGHVPHLEQPQATAAAILAFLNQSSK